MTDPRRLDAARRMVGAPRDAPATPALLLDLPRVDRNIAEMARRMDTLPAALRPHAKVHKSPILARRQIAAGAIGITTANVWEASALLDDGIDGVLIANQVVGPVKAAELARSAGLGQVLVAVDDASNVDQLAAAARDAGTEIGVLVELDVGLHRAGVRGIEPAVELGAHVTRQAGLRLAGLLGYEGHCMLEPDRALRISKAHASNDLLIAAADAFGRAGLCTDVVAAGGLGTWDITGANPRITEIHAGTYVFMDAFHARLVPGFEVALTVLGTVMSRSGDTAVLDCGRKAFGLDRGLPEIVGGGRLGALRARRALGARGAPRARSAGGLAARGGRPHRARTKLRPHHRQSLRHVPRGRRLPGRRRVADPRPLRQPVGGRRPARCRLTRTNDRRQEPRCPTCPRTPR